MPDIRHAASSLAIDEMNALTREIIDALEGDSNDAEHDALVSVAQALGLSYDPPDL